MPDGSDGEEPWVYTVSKEQEEHGRLPGEARVEPRRRTFPVLLVTTDRGG
jgi:hypothetical protein